MVVVLCAKNSSRLAEKIGGETSVPIAKNWRVAERSPLLLRRENFYASYVVRHRVEGGMRVHGTEFAGDTASAVSWLLAKRAEHTTTSEDSGAYDLVCTSYCLRVYVSYVRTSNLRVSEFLRTVPPLGCSHLCECYGGIVCVSSACLATTQDTIRETSCPASA